MRATADAAPAAADAIDTHMHTHTCCSQDTHTHTRRWGDLNKTSNVHVHVRVSKFSLLLQQKSAAYFVGGCCVCIGACVCGREWEYVCAGALMCCACSAKSYCHCRCCSCRRCYCFYYSCFHSTMSTGNNTASPHEYI